MSKFTPDQLLERLEWRREIRNTMGRISHDLCVQQDADIYDRYWSGRDDVSLTINKGTYLGAQDVKNYYQAAGQRIALTSKLIVEKFPEAFEGMTQQQTYGVGMINYFPLDSHVIEIADDAQTAKAIFNVRGSYCYLTQGGPVSNWTYGWVAADFVMEDGFFKIWHMAELYNVDNPCGISFIDAPKTFEAVPGFEAINDFAMPAPTTTEGAMDYYHPMRPVTPSPRVPEPYGTFADTFSYGI